MSCEATRWVELEMRCGDKMESDKMRCDEKIEKTYEVGESGR